jgi:protein TonB
MPVRVSSAYTDFSKSFLSRNLMGSSSRRTLAISIVLHTLLIGIPLLVSAWFTDTLDLRTYSRILLVAPPAAPTPRPPAAAPDTQLRPQPHRVFTSQGKLLLPPAIPRQIAMLNEAPLPPEPDSSGIVGGIPGGLGGGVMGGLLEGIKGPEAPAAPPVRAAVEKPRNPVPVGGDVRPPRVIFQLSPEYPILAQQAGIQGEVIISAVIDSQGNVVNMKVVSGPPLLYLAAMKALAKWKFEPTYLDGEPVAIKWDVSVKFYISRPSKIQ